ncbi:MAG TPA: ABC transporter substrate-binding protein [Nitrospiraceae bacterium]|nr:ABC transporter substrate-binding protein [Nitrospiraceae bacterium]
MTNRWAVKITAVGLGVCLSLAVSACAQDSSSDARTILVFKHGKLAARPGALAAVLREFERRHPGVIVRDEVLPSTSDQQHQFYAVNLESRNPGIDLLAADLIWVQEFARAGWIRDLEDVITSAERREFFPAAVEAATFAGRLYAAPWYVDAGVLFYRRDLLERYGFPPPRTWPELARTARAILDRERDPVLKGFVWQGKQYEGLVCTALELIRSYGGDLPAGDDTAIVEALVFMRSLITEGISPQSVATADEETSRHQFGAGHAIFMRNWPYAWTIFQREGSPVRGKIGLAPLPSTPGQASSPVLGGWTLAIPTRTAHAKEAGTLLKYLTSPEVQETIAKEIGYNPTRPALYRNNLPAHHRLWFEALYPMLEAAKPRPVTPYYLMLSQAWQPELSAALVGTKSATAALASLRRQTAYILSLEADWSVSASTTLGDWREL